MFKIKNYLNKNRIICLMNIKGKNFKNHCNFSTNGKFQDEALETRDGSIDLEILLTNLHKTKYTIEVN